MLQDARIDDVASDAGSTIGSPHGMGLPDFPLPPMYPESASQQASGPFVHPRMEVDPIGRQMRPSSSQSGRRSLNTQWSTLGHTSPRATDVRKKKGVDPSIAALQSQLSHVTGELGEQLGATLQFAGHASLTA